jgi:hypothetical protein
MKVIGKNEYTARISTAHLSTDEHEKMKIHEPLIPETELKIAYLPSTTATIHKTVLVTVILSSGLIPIAYLKDK